MAEAKTSQSISRSKPPILTAALDTQPGRVSDQILLYLCLSFFKSHQIAIPIHTMYIQNHTDGMGSKSWFGSPVIGQASLSSHPTIEKRHQSALADQSRCSHLPVAQSQMATGKSIVNLEVCLKKRYLISTWILLGFNLIFT